MRNLLIVRAFSSCVPELRCDVIWTEVGLVALLRVLWRKYSENPATLDYFTFEDRR